MLSGDSLMIDWQMARFFCIHRNRYAAQLHDYLSAPHKCFRVSEPQNCSINPRDVVTNSLHDDPELFLNESFRGNWHGTRGLESMSYVSLLWLFKNL
jgi:hypothetical protein